MSSTRSVLIFEQTSKLKVSDNSRTCNQNLNFWTLLFSQQIFSSLGTILRIVTFTKSGEFLCMLWVQCELWPHTQVIKQHISLLAELCKKLFAPWVLHSVHVKTSDKILSSLSNHCIFCKISNVQNNFYLNIGLMFSLAEKFQALIEFSSTSEAELAKLVRRPLNLLRWLPGLSRTIMLYSSNWCPWCLCVFFS